MKFLLVVFKWMFTELIIELSRFNFWVSSAPYPEAGLDYDEEEEQISIKEVERTEKKIDDAEWLKKRSEMVENQTVYYPCDKKSDLYVLQRKFSQEKIRYTLSAPTNGSR